MSSLHSAIWGDTSDLFTDLPETSLHSPPPRQLARQRASREPPSSASLGSATERHQREMVRVHELWQESKLEARALRKELDELKQRHGTQLDNMFAHIRSLQHVNATQEAQLHDAHHELEVARQQQVHAGDLLERTREQLASARERAEVYLSRVHELEQRLGTSLSLSPPPSPPQPQRVSSPGVDTSLIDILAMSQDEPNATAVKRLSAKKKKKHPRRRSRRRAKSSRKPRPDDSILSAGSPITKSLHSLPPRVASLTEEFLRESERSEILAASGFSDNSENVQSLATLLIRLNREWQKDTTERLRSSSKRSARKINKLKRRLRQRVPYKQVVQQAEIDRLQNNIKRLRAKQLLRDPKRANPLLELSLQTIESLSQQLLDTHARLKQLEHDDNDDDEDDIFNLTDSVEYTTT